MSPPGKTSASQCITSVVPRTAPSGSPATTASGATRARSTPPPSRPTRPTSRHGVPAARAARTSRPSSARIPSRATSAGRRSPPRIAFATAHSFTAESQPSTSYDGSSSAIPSRRACAIPSSIVPPASTASSTTVAVEVKTPRTARSPASGRHARASENTGAPSITADSNR